MPQGMIKTLHITTVTISILLFVSRGFWIYILKNQLTAKWIKILPHVNDTIVLLSGITLAVQVQQYPFVHHWLTVKIICLLTYILFGMIAMKWSVNKTNGFIAWLLAIVIFAFMVSVAISKNSAGIFY